MLKCITGHISPYTQTQKRYKEVGFFVFRKRVILLSRKLVSHVRPLSVK